jgi:REP element-mobilizing transposase RayT
MLKRHFHRRRLPHLYYNEGIYFITYRLHGSISPGELERIQRIIKDSKAGKKNIRIFKKYDSLMDNQNNKIDYLRNPKIAKIYEHSLHFSDGKDYKLICYCIMPNHIHVVFELVNQKKSISDIMGAIKRNSAKDANKVLNRSGAFWQAESFDRLVRDDKELYFIIKYVLLNPVNGGLATDWNEWKYTYCHPDYLVL